MDASGDMDFKVAGNDDGVTADIKHRAAVKASGKTKESGKSSVLMDVKPWDDETDMVKLEEAVRSVHFDAKLIPYIVIMLYFPPTFVLPIHGNWAKPGPDSPIPVQAYCLTDLLKKGVNMLCK
ncbi:hypothetical protein CTI12_AA591320 [Artemisia annua]|uniref:Translation elongation factor EF1B beta/delta subunit guanine nucleotide exchange domain-containing protein n=1 Tax=Artemisia annua TaxID=35608 RepID=A0A2U1KKU2_ARTAN|nr:hypothetical protein CTI12_AA591320 [Artemisia annua]